MCMAKIEGVQTYDKIRLCAISLIMCNHCKPFIKGQGLPLQEEASKHHLRSATYLQKSVHWQDYTPA